MTKISTTDGAPRRISDITPEEVAAHVREARRLRSKAVGQMLTGVGRAMKRAVRRDPAGKPAVGHS